MNERNESEQPSLRDEVGSERLGEVGGGYRDGVGGGRWFGFLGRAVGGRGGGEEARATTERKEDLVVDYKVGSIKWENMSQC